MNELNNDYKPSEPISNASTIETPHYPPRSFFVTAGAVVFIIGIAVGFFGATIQQAGDEITYDEALTILNLDRQQGKTTVEPSMDLFWSIWDIVKERHVEQPVSEKELFYGAVSGMVAGLGDPYSVYFDPDEAKEFLGEINGSFEGIGAEIGLKNEKITVIAPLPESPAEKAGVRAGDHIVAIDGLNTAYMTVNTAVQHIRGEKGTTVTLLMKRENVVDPLEIQISRDTIHIESVKWEMVNSAEKSIALITVSHFNSDTAAKFQGAVNAIVLEQPDSIILDLRNNAGGLLDAAIDIASKFEQEGSVVLYEESSDQTQKAYTATGPSPLDGREVVVLINEGSASASEIVAGALKDHGTAVLIGETSFGKGTVQDLQTFDDGSALKVTVARWLTPNQHLIDTLGIDPNYLVERTNDDYSNDLDPQMDAAKLYLTDRISFNQKYQPFTSTSAE